VTLPLVVPDASVILKWVLPSEDEPRADRALMLLDAIIDNRIHAVVPAFWLYEAGNTVSRRFPEHSGQWMNALMKLDLEVFPATGRWLELALELTREHGVTFYDAAYHAVAVTGGGVFVTADARYVDKTRAVGHLALLSDWKAPSVELP